MNYKISWPDPTKKYLKISSIVPNIQSNKTIIHIPAWRPGRYEIQNFSQFIRKMKAIDENGKLLKIVKIDKDSWQIYGTRHKTIGISYEFFADAVNAGGSYVDDHFFYLNPVNCLIYRDQDLNEPCKLNIEYPNNQQVACGMNFLKSDNYTEFSALSYHDLVDSPVMMARYMHHLSYELHGSQFHIWIRGLSEIPEERIISDFKKFTQCQIAIFGEFPESNYHFMLWVLAEPAYHGVEHHNSTMMTLGPNTQDFEELYIDLLGLASHELFHTWNVKRIRPKEMLPYDYQKENYFNTCFVAEGLTTLYGDWMLLRSGVFTKTQFVKELESTFRRHFEFCEDADLSLLESSFDLWLDGYKKGAPDRKVSVYHKGAIAGLILHYLILKNTNQEKGLDDLMRAMWLRHGKPFVGYTYQDYIQLAEEIAGVKLSKYFKKVIEGNESIFKEANAALHCIDLRMSKTNDGHVVLKERLKKLG